ncbi:hypothetical protein [Hyphomicrobium sp. D-2]|uniref:hypothetical protein n=1 Tax=Hyphomicrobium sp. D-2 TaxID=3041621 RepID=UPI002456F727|nr:hypothetical protein [Hyphomicrobium sp. D-2]MDH4981562.1 hypothetical protein [Hyphomicrobium sp. D-2]
MQTAEQQAERAAAARWWMMALRRPRLGACAGLCAAVVFGLMVAPATVVAQDKPAAADKKIEAEAAKPETVKTEATKSDAGDATSAPDAAKAGDEAAAKDEAPKPDWDQVANIKEAATRLAQIQRTQGASGAFAFIDACYRTHRLSSAYTRAFEACIAQDYLETQILSLVYSRMPLEVLQRMKAPSPDMLAGTMLRRVSAAFGQYKLSKEQVAEFKRNIDAHGFPIMFAALFPNTPVPQVPQAIPEDDTSNDGPDNGASKPDTLPTPDKAKPEKP